MPTDPLNPGPTKDSQYSQKYVKSGIYPDSARSTSQSALHQNISSQVPEYSEFKRDGAPTTSQQRAYEVYMRQSEFKKPYLSDGYREMETDADPPPGFRRTNRPGGVDSPAIPNVNEPIVDPGGPVTVIFNAYIDEDYEYGGFCRGQNGIIVRVYTTEPCYSITVTYSEPNTNVTLVGGAGTNEIYLQVDADNNQFAYITVEMHMRSYEGITGESNVNIMEVVCSEYYMLRIQGGTADVATIYDATNDQIATNIPDNAGTGTVSMPCNYSELTNFLNQATPLEVHNIASFNYSPSWGDAEYTIAQPSGWGLHPSPAACSTGNQPFPGSGTWPRYTTQTSVPAPVNGVGCNYTINETNYEDDFYTYNITINLSGYPPVCYIETKPFAETWYGEHQGEFFGTRVNCEITGLTQGGGVGIVRTYVKHDSTMYWHEDADYNTHTEANPNPPPPTIQVVDDYGSGNWQGTFDYIMEMYTFFDSNPLYTWEHTVLHGEGWTRTFRLAGSVLGYSRAFTASAAEPRGNYAPVAAKGFSRYLQPFGVYGAHTGILGFMAETWQVSGTKKDDSGSGNVSLFTNWEDDAAVTVTDEQPWGAVHAGVYYGEEFAETINICNDLSRSSNLESGVEDLLDKYKTEEGLASTDIGDVDTWTVSSTIIM
jgi:hypothetical protein